MKKIYKMASFLSGFFALNSSLSNADTLDKSGIDQPDIFHNSIISPLNPITPWYIAKHSSHASHGSHGSHRSSSGGTPRPKIYKPPLADPLGQPKKPQYSKPVPKSPPPKEGRVTDKEKKFIIIMRVQLALKLLGLYDYKIDGLLGPSTRESIRKYRLIKDLPAGQIIDSELLNSLGVPAP
jgi:His-Xaa-Ser repeat protein HxsA